MTDCEELIDDLHSQTRNHVHLAVLSNDAAVAGMYLDLAQFSQAQARIAEELCVDGSPPPAVAIKRTR